MKDYSHSHHFIKNDPYINRNERKTLFVVILTAMMMVVEIVAGYLTGSMALLADGWHMASHATALGISVITYRLAKSQKLQDNFSFGAGKFIPLGGYTSAIMLAMMAIFMGYESIRRLIHPEAIFFDQAIEGHGLTGNVRCLIDANLKDRRGRNFARSTVAKILQDQTYIGNTVFNRRDSKTNQPKDRSEWVIVQGTHPGIIPENIFQEAQKSIESRSPEKTNGRVFQSPRIFSELLYCKECGGKLTADTAQGRSRKYSYYTCRNRRFGKKESCVGIRVSAPELDSALLKNILSRIFSKSNLKSCLEEWNNIYKEEKNKGTGQKIKIQKALQKIETKRQNLVEAIANGVLNPDDVKETMAKIREDRCKLEIELAQLNRSDLPQFRINDDFIESVRKSFIEMVNVEKPVQTKTFIRKFVKGVDVSSDEVKINYILPDVKATTQNEGGRGSYSRPSWLRVLDSNQRPID